jgi:excisionase family DNA binding protein
MNENECLDMFAELPDLLNPSDLQKALRVGRTQVYRLLDSGEIRHLRIGRAYKIPKCYVVDFILSSCYVDDVATNPSSREVK